MEIANKNIYYNSIYKAIVVNTSTNQDPRSLNRIQIYIPSQQYRYDGIYETYMDSNDKTNSDHFSKFPWAVSLVDDLEEGNVVYGSYIDNINGNYIIIGRNSLDTSGAGSGGRK